MITVKREPGTGGYMAETSGLYGVWCYGKSPENALDGLERHADIGCLRPYVREIHRHLIAWDLSYAQLHAGINTGTMVL